MESNKYCQVQEQEMAAKRGNRTLKCSIWDTRPNLKILRKEEPLLILALNLLREKFLHNQ